jgi:hypothetical protein
VRSPCGVSISAWHRAAIFDTLGLVAGRQVLSIDVSAFEHGRRKRATLKASLKY